MKIPVFNQYERFYRYMKGWAFRSIDSLIVVGTPGVGKTFTAKKLLRGRPHHWFSAKQTPLEIYTHICDAPHIPIVFDDVAALLRDKTFLDLLKNLCERGTSTLRWGTNTHLLEGRPTSFRTTAKVLIFLNSLPKKNEGDLAAVLDRCHHFSFEPDKAQVIAYMREYFPDDRKLIDLMAGPARITGHAWQDGQCLGRHLSSVLPCKSAFEQKRNEVAARSHLSNNGQLT